MGCCMASRTRDTIPAAEEKRGYVYGFFDMKDPEEFDNVYSQIVQPTLKPYGGKLILKHALPPPMAAKMDMRESKGFGTTGQMAFMLQFDTFEKAMGWFTGPEYASVIEKCDEVADFKMAVVEGARIPAGSGLVVGFIDLKKPEEFENVHNPMVEPTLKPYGGKLVIMHALVPTMAEKMGMKEPKGFGTTGQMAFVLQFADFEKAMGWFTGPEYAAVREKRDEVADFKMAVVECIQDPDMYTDATSLFDTLAVTVEGYHPVRLIRMSWLLRQRGTVLRRRQEMPEEAYVPAEELWKIWEASGRGGRDKVAPIITISFCWDTREHPDPEGKQLNLVIDTLEKERHKYARAEDSFRGFREMGVFWDWTSVLQVDPVKAEEAKRAALRQGKSKEEAEKAADQAKRTPAEKAAFKYALQKTMDLWYGHQATTVFLLTQHPRERGSDRKEGYDQSGWTTYERCSAEQIKRVYRSEAKWSAVADLGQGPEAKAAGRRWPVCPDEFDALVEGKVFKNGSDRDAVKESYRRMGRVQLSNVTKLDFEGMPPPTPEQAAGLAGCLRLCARLEELYLDGCGIDDASAKAVAGALPYMGALIRLDLDGNRICDAGAQAMAGALPSMGALETLWLNRNAIGDAGAQAVAGALPSMGALRELRLSGNGIGDAGAQAVAGALPSTPGLMTLYLRDNGIGEGAKAAVRAAWGGRSNYLNF